MIVLQEGQQYSLSTEDNNNKSLFFVKLTDSALQSIERFLKSEHEPISKPTVQFKNNTGTISLPLNGQKHNYAFTLSNIEGDGSFQCLQHSGDRSLESLGSMLIKMQIHAKEDSYEKTKFKMAAADQEQKSFCTKEIKQNGTRLSQKFKVKRPGLVLPQEKNHLSIKKPEPAKLNFNNKCNGSSPLQKPIRERIIHILAVKPYKKPDLLLRLIKEGTSAKDKNSIAKILNEVATLKGNFYNLSNHLWNEVQENWEFCSKEELKLIQRRKQFLKSSNEVPCSKTLTNCSALQSVISSEPAVNGNKSLSKKQKTLHNGSIHTNEITRNGSSVFSCSKKFNLPTTSVSQKLSFTQKVNGDFNGASKKNSSFSCESDSVVLKNISEKKGIHNHISVPKQTSATDYNMSSSQELTQMSIKEVNHKISKNKCKGVVNNNNNIVNRQSNVSSLSSPNLASTSTQAMHNGNSYCEVKGNKVFDHKKTDNSTFANGQCSPKKLSVLERSVSYSPVFHANSLSSNKKKEKSTGFDVKLLPVMDSVLEIDTSEIVLNYPRIESVEQRTQYVKDFNCHYEEYLELHTQMKNISDKFMTLSDHLNTSVKGSIESKKIKSEIAKEYKRIMQNNAYDLSRKKFEFLKAKLSHIRQLITEYDNSQDPKS